MSNSSSPPTTPKEKFYTEIIVIRHGETDWNLNKKFQGQLDVALNETGKEQAAAVANRLANVPKISAIYSSNLKRAFETAQIISNSCGKLEVVQDKNLRERHLGVLQGLLKEKAKTLQPEALRALWSRKREQAIPGGGESFDQLYERCTASLQIIGERHKGERVVVVTHYGVIKALLKRAEMEGGKSELIENASINVFHLSGDGDWVVKI